MTSIIGLTGGIGAGKSVVSRILRTRGFEVYDCDIEARRIMDGSDSLKRDIAERMGTSCLRADGSLDRKEIARHVFSDDSHRRWLNSRVHGLVCEDVAGRARTCGRHMLFVESALLKTSGLAALCDCIWLVDAPEGVRLERACRRDGADAADILARMRAQESEFENFGENVDMFVIDNGDNDSLLPQIDNILTQIKKNHA